MGDALSDEPARLITAVGKGYVQARRYRPIAAACEQWLADALAIGARLRAQARSTAGELPSDPDAVRQLLRLIGELEAAIRRVHESDVYRRALRAWDEAAFHEVTAWAVAIFDGVVPQPNPPTLYVPVEVTSRGTGDQHFASAWVVAERVVALLREGIPAAQPPPDLGADDRIGAVLFDDDPETCGSPVSIVVAPGELGLPLVRLEPSGTVLAYAPFVRVAASVRCAAHVSDEWWATRPDAYAGFTTELSRELVARGVTRIEHC